MKLWNWVNILNISFNKDILPLEQINEAFQTYVERKDGALKVVVHP